MRKKLINYTPKYNPGDIVYAMAIEREDGNASNHADNSWDWNFAKIFKVEINNIHIAKDGIEYWVCEPNKPNTEWGGPCKEEEVNKDIKILWNLLQIKWKL